MNKNFFQSDRAVSEVIGYALVFGIIVTAIGLIYVAGLPALQSSKDTTQFKSVEQGFMILRTDLLKVALDQSPVRTTKLGTAEGGSLSSDPSACKLSLKIFESTNPVFDDTIELGNIEFASRIGSISCENGAVVTKYPSGSIMTSKPRMFNSTDQGNIMFSLVKINDSFSSVGGGIARITISNPRFNESIFSTPEVYRNGKLKIKVDSEYADAWERFLEDEFDTAFTDSTDDTTGLSDPISFNKLVVVEYIVSVDVG
ncbi:MAG: hypothetical protein U9N07_04330 [Euryarchaeota archaeon]|nr:hypothetical protein [Euryarchaeota archaeon]